MRIIEETPDTRSVVLGIPEALAATFAYRAGQFLSFGVVLDGHQLVRCYSLASSPDSEREYKVTIKRVPDGRVSNWFHDHVAVGQALHVMKPSGHFCLQARQSPLMLFAAGSGITPVISLLKSALIRGKRSIRLLYANRDEESIIFRDELEALASAHPDRLEVTHRLDGVEGFLDLAAARSSVAAQPGADFYLCGPAPFMDVVEAALEAESIPQEQVFIERFVLSEAQVAEEGAPPQPGAELPSLTVYLDGRLHEVAVRGEETILAACNRAGLDAPCACTEGYCGACMALVKEGEVEMQLNDGGLDAEQVRKGWVLTCQSLARSSGVRIDYPDPD
jgi:3-ketosteroid 9alpha-monooxygenase subunit B